MMLTNKSFMTVIEGIKFDNIPDCIDYIVNHELGNKTFTAFINNVEQYFKVDIQEFPNGDACVNFIILGKRAK